MAVTTDKERKQKPVIPVPDDPENLHISKAQFVEKRRKLKEKEAKLKAYAQELDAQSSDPDLEKEETQEIPKEIKKPGRPKKTEA